LLQPSAEIVDLFLQSVDVLKQFLHRQWPNDAEMASAVDPLLARIAEFAPEETEEGAGSETSRPEVAAGTLAPSAEAISVSGAPRPAAAQALPQAKSVRISLEWLDRMMNAVGELVINRTRMLGRLSELSKLVEVLQFSKVRLSSKVSEFQEKHEFSRIRSTLLPGTHPPQMDTFRGHSRSLGSVTTNDLLDFSDLEMD